MPNPACLLPDKSEKEKYDVAFNLHGGTTATFFVRASGARYRVGYKTYQYSFLYNQLLSSASDFWKKNETHSAEQQMALLGFVGVPVNTSLKTRLEITKDALESVEKKCRVFGFNNLKDFALIHPAAAFETKQWATSGFAKVAAFLSEKDIYTIAVGTKKERSILDTFEKLSKVPILTLDNLTLPEITALSSRATIFVGNDSGIAHIAAAVKTPSVVIFGSSNRNHWHPWTDAPNEMVYEEFPCQPCAGSVCKEFDVPKCILNIEVQDVIIAIEESI